MPLYHGTGFTTAVSCLCAGLTICVGKKFSTSKFWTDVRDSDATAFVYVGETARYLLAAPPSHQDREHKAKVMFGNGMRPDVWHRFVDRFGIETVGEFFNSTEGVFGLLNVCRGTSIIWVFIIYRYLTHTRPLPRHLRRPPRRNPTLHVPQHLRPRRNQR